MRRSSAALRFRLSRLSLRAWPVWLVAASLALGSLPVHSGLEQHGALDGATRVWLTDCPPGPARHLEPSTSVELPRCVACVLRLQTLGAQLDAPRKLAAFARLGDAPAPLAQTPASAPLRLPASRGPPLA